MVEQTKNIIEIIRMLKELKNVDFVKIINFTLLYINTTVSIWFQNTRKIVSLVEKNDDTFPQLFFLANVLIACIIDTLPIFDNTFLNVKFDIIYHFASFLAKVISLFLWFGIIKFIAEKIFFNIHEDRIKKSILYASAWLPLLELLNESIYYFVQSLSYAEIIYRIYNPVINLLTDYIEYQTTAALLGIIIMLLSCTFFTFILCITLWGRTIFKAINIATNGQKLKFARYIFFIILGINVIQSIFIVCMYIYPVFNMQEAMDAFDEERYILKKFTEDARFKNEIEIDQTKYILAYKVNKLKTLEEICYKVISDTRLPIEYRYPYELYGITCILQKQNDFLIFLKGDNYQDIEVSAMMKFLLDNRPDMLEIAIGSYINKQHLIEMSLLPDDYIKYKFYLQKFETDKKIIEDKKITMKIMPELSSKKETVISNINFYKFFIETILKNESRFWKIFLRLINVIP